MILEIAQLPMNKILSVSLALWLAVQAPAWAAESVPPNAPCSTPEGATQARAQVDASLKSVKEAQRQREVLLDQQVRSTAKQLGWTQQALSQFFVGLMNSDQFAAFEREKRPLTQELMAMLKSAFQQGGPASPAEVCEAALRIQAIVEQVKTVNARQYDFMSGEVSAAADQAAASAPR